MSPGHEVICRSKCLRGRVGFDDSFAVAYGFSMDDAEKPVLDSVEKLDRLHWEEMACRNVVMLNHTWSGRLRSPVDSEGHVSTQAKIGHSHAALVSGAHALQAV